MTTLPISPSRIFKAPDDELSATPQATTTSQKCVDSSGRLSVLSQVRKKRCVSQRCMAKKMHITRTQLQRIENKKSEKLFLWELKLFAGALQISLNDLVQIIYGDMIYQAQVTRCSLSTPSTVVKFEEGIDLDCIAENPKRLFIGRLNILPQKSFFLKKFPGVENFLFAVVLQGTACVDGTEPMVLKEKDGFFGENLSSLVIHNTQPLLKLSMLVMMSRNEC